MTRLVLLFLTLILPEESTTFLSAKPFTTEDIKSLSTEQSLSIIISPLDKDYLMILCLLFDFFVLPFVYLDVFLNFE